MCLLFSLPIARDEVYDEHTAQKGNAEIIINQHRNGPRGDVVTF
ncbi:MAG: hypothetical protein F4227_05815 [Gammaproteobacteria bacterium]|nr:hypothetical protein [Gammaproteobacteria bacterium]MYF02482.1 hypothetical protein [Gammaproteobacteria bacterium]MYI76623.1 hypothetical protein [Gammaproteobacteria bacterium]